MVKPADAATRSRMRTQRRRDTVLEVEIRRRLHALGYRYRVDLRLEPSLRTRADVVFTKKRVAVYVDGCFWHGCPEHATQPKNNAEWWRAKLAANVARDRRVEAVLQDLGWVVVRIWEHEDPEDAVARVIRQLAAKNSE